MCQSEEICSYYSAQVYFPTRLKTKTKSHTTSPIPLPKIYPLINQITSTSPPKLIARYHSNGELLQKYPNLYLQWPDCTRESVSTSEMLFCQLGISAVAWKEVYFYSYCWSLSLSLYFICLLLSLPVCLHLSCYLISLYCLISRSLPLIFCPLRSLSLFFFSLWGCLVFGFEEYNPLPPPSPSPQKTMSRYTWECKTKEESDCEVRPNVR